MLELKLVGLLNPDGNLSLVSDNCSQVEGSIYDGFVVWDTYEDAESDLEEEASLVNRVIKEARESDRRLKQSMEDAVVEMTRDRLREGEEEVSDTFEEALTTRAEEASSEIVQAELAAMREAIQNFVENARKGLSSSLEEIAEDYKDINVGTDTPRDVLNNLLARYPKTSEVKG